MALDAMKGGAAQRDAAMRRAMMLARLQTMTVEQRGVECLPSLFRALDEDKALLGLHVAQVDRVVFGAGRAASLRHVSQAAAWCDADVTVPGRVTLAWLLDARTGGARLCAWLLAVALDLGFALSGPDPYQAASRATAVPSRSQTDHSRT